MDAGAAGVIITRKITDCETVYKTGDGALCAAFKPSSYLGFPRPEASGKPVE